MTTEREPSYAEERAAQREAERERWAKRNAHHTTDRLPIQVDPNSTFRGPLHGAGGKRCSVPRVVAEAAWEGYAADGHGGQSSETLHERGGFGLAELGYYLARAVDEERITIALTREPRSSGDLPDPDSPSAVVTR